VVSLNGATGRAAVAVDAMGGDFAPDEVLKGAIDAQRRGTKVILVGRGEVIRQRLADLHADLPFVDAPDSIGMHEAVSPALRHRQSSLQVAANLVSTGDAGAVVSCGNSAAIYFVAFHAWDTQPGIDRPAFGGSLPARNGSVFVVDIGANHSVGANNLVQFAVMGDVFVRVSRQLEAPRIALLSNGSEDSKGTKEIKEANQALRNLDLNFVGNVEGNEVFEGGVDVVVCDGFSGNVLLKGGEGVASEIFLLLREELSKDPISRLAAAALRPAFRRIRRRMDYEEYGGAPVLGVNGVMINCHGRSKGKAVMNAILMAERMAREHLVDRIGDALHRDDLEVRPRRKRLVRALHLRHE
jgi:glycerol-3-phosphate acyltransferase PlsX